MNLRTTRGLELCHVERLAAAAGHALHIGHRLDAFVTVTFGHELPDGGRRAVACVLEQLRHWQAYRGVPGGAFIWWRETAVHLGHHMHLAMHLPAGENLTTLTAAFRRWRRAVPGDENIRCPVKAKRIHPGRPEPTGPAAGMPTHRPLRGLLRYAAKGLVVDADAELLGVRRKPQEAGRVLGKRCGVAQGLGPAARQAWEARRRALQGAQTGSGPAEQDVTRAA